MGAPVREACSLGRLRRGRRTRSPPPGHSENRFEPSCGIGRLNIERTHRQHHEVAQGRVATPPRTLLGGVLNGRPASIVRCRSFFFVRPPLEFYRSQTHVKKVDKTLHVTCPNCGGVNRIPPDRLDQNPRCGVCHRPLFTGKPVELNETNFAAVINKTELPVVVDFWAAWCAPCKMMAPFFEQAAGRLEPRVRLAKLDTEAAPQIAARFGIRSIPTLIVFKNSQEIARQAGALNLDDLVRFIESSI